VEDLQLRVLYRHLIAHQVCRVRRDHQHLRSRRYQPVDAVLHQVAGTTGGVAFLQ